jgi:outer membrane protein insertion porin family
MTKKIISSLLLFTWFISIHPGFHVLAEDGQKIVKKVDIKGNRTVNEELIRSRIKTHEGSPFLQSDVDDDLKRLYAMGFFTDVLIDVREELGGVGITFILVEKAVIKEIIFDGNKKYKQKKLKKQMKANIGDRLNESQLKEDVQAIEDFYREKGFPRTKVDYSLSVDKEIGDAIVNIHVQEGPRIKIRLVDFEGNKV